MESKVINTGNPKVVKVVSVAATLKRIPVGKTVRFAAGEMYMPSVRAFVYRENKKAGREVYTMNVYNYGAEFDVTRK